jgi:hypothetical protein
MDALGTDAVLESGETRLGRAAPGMHLRTTRDAEAGTPAWKASATDGTPLPPPAQAAVRQAAGRRGSRRSRCVISGRVRT